MTGWRKSSYSADQGGDCVEVAAMRRTVAVRDSKNPAGPALRFTPAEWTTFLTDVKNGRPPPPAVILHLVSTPRA